MTYLWLAFFNCYGTICQISLSKRNWRNKFIAKLFEKKDTIIIIIIIIIFFQEATHPIDGFQVGSWVKRKTKGQLQISYKFTRLTFATSIMLNSGFFFVCAHFVFVFARAFVGYIVVITERLRHRGLACLANTVVGGLTSRFAYSIKRTRDVDTGMIIWKNEGSRCYSRTLASLKPRSQYRCDHNWIIIKFKLKTSDERILFPD